MIDSLTASVADVEIVGSPTMRRLARAVYDAAKAGGDLYVSQVQQFVSQGRFLRARLRGREASEIDERIDALREATDRFADAAHQELTEVQPDGTPRNRELT